MENKRIAFSPPDITQEEIDEVIDTLRSGWITTGPKTKQFENGIAQYCNTKKAVALNSATAGLELTLRLLEIGPGDEVITCAYTYSASASVIDHVGAKIVLADSGKNSFYIDYDALPLLITEKTKAIIAVDVAGIMCDYDRILRIAERNKHKFIPRGKLQEVFGRIIIISDAAHSMGAQYNDKKSGEAADFTVFSFHAVKNLTTAEGGAVTWKEIEGIDTEDIYQKFMLFSLHGQTKDAMAKTKIGKWEYDIEELYYKCNMTDIVASLGIVQLRRYPEILKRRKKIIETYDRLLKDMDVTPLCHYTQQIQSSGHLYLLRLNGKSEEFRNHVIEKMGRMEVATNVHYKPLPLFTAYKKRGFIMDDYPNAYEMYQNEITLPLHTLLSDDDIVYVIDCFKKAMMT